MKTRLLYLLLFAFGTSFAQFPTNGLVAQYGFNSGSFVDGANGVSLVQNGSALTAVDDRFTAVNTNAINLNGDFLTRPDVDFTSNSGSISFWIKTSTNNSNVETIFDDTNNRNSVADNTNWSGYYLFLENGKVGFVIQQLFAEGNIGRVGVKKTGTTVISDGKWHHIVLSVTQVITPKNVWIAGKRRQRYLTTTNLYIDDIFVDQAKIDRTTHGGFQNNGNWNTTGDIVIANNGNNNLPTTNTYKDAIDDVFIYNKTLTRAEVGQLRQDNNFCIPPSNNIIGLSNIGNTTATITLSGTGNYDLAYYKSNESISNATIINNVTTNPVNLTGLSISTSYTIKVREYCNNVSDWSNDFVFTTSRPAGKLYVNASATGDNNGTDWQNAFTDLQDALSIIQTYNEKEVWIAGGTYKPHATNRTATFGVNRGDVKIYGGFAGTETLLSERVLGTNETILSGDLQGNDVNVTDFSSNYANTTRNTDNSYHIFRVFNGGDNLLLDGITFSDAHNNKSSTERGGAIIKYNRVTKLTLRNCVVKNNVSRNDNAGLIAEFDLNNTTATKRGALIIENCQFINNMSRWASGIYSFVRANTNVDITVANSLFNNNLSADLSSTLKGLSGSASWFNVVANGSDVNLNLTNNTYVNNIDLGTDQSLNNFTRATVAISKGAGITSTFNASVNNTIFWNNTTLNGVTTRAISDQYLVPANSLVVNNSLDPFNFNDDSIASKTATISTDPLFTNATSFTLQATSPALDVGDNSKIIGTTDLLGNNRIYNTTVDLGAYEFNPTLSINNFTFNNDVEVFPNPTSTHINIKTSSKIDTIYIYNLKGQKTVESSHKNINISKLSKGIYILKIKNIDGNISTRKFIKN